MRRASRLVPISAYDGAMSDFSHPAADPVKLLAQWMDWERGDETPGRVMANLKTGGLRELLESLVAAKA